MAIRSGRSGFGSMDPEQRRRMGQRGGESSQRSRGYGRSYEQNRYNDDDDDEDYEVSSEYDDDYDEEDDFDVYGSYDDEDVDDEDYDEDYDEEEDYEEGDRGGYQSFRGRRSQEGRGFASMPPERRRRIAAMGGRASAQSRSNDQRRYADQERYSNQGQRSNQSQRSNQGRYSNQGRSNEYFGNMGNDSRSGFDRGRGSRSENNYGQYENDRGYGRRDSSDRRENYSSGYGSYGGSGFDGRSRGSNDRYGIGHGDNRSSGDRRSSSGRAGSSSRNSSSRDSGSSRRGFAAMSPAKRRRIAAMGGRASHGGR